MPWMTDLFYDAALDGAPLGPFRNRPLRQMTLPGTHDSGCYRNQSLWNVYSATQTQDIGRQLAGGIRYFDIRPCAKGIEFWTYHGKFYWGGEITGDDGILQQIRDYFDSLAVTDRELVILNISHFAAFTDVLHGTLVHTIESFLAPHLVAYTQRDINIFDCPYWQLLSEPEEGEHAPPEVMPANLRSRVLILYDGALDTPIENYVATGPFTLPDAPINGFFVLSPKYVPVANPIKLFDQYANSGRVEDGYILSGMRVDQLNKLRNRRTYRYSQQPFGAGYWSANAPTGVAGTLHLLSWTLTPQFSLTFTGTWDPLVAAQQTTNPQLLNLFCGDNMGWTGACYDPAVDDQINIIYVDDYASTLHWNRGYRWHGLALPVAIAARMNVGPVGQGTTW